MAKDSSIILERRFVPEGAIIMRQGEQGNCAYLIQSGRVRVYTEHDGRRVDLAKLELGEIFGEMALIFDEPRSASVVADEDCNLIVLTRQTFKSKLNKSDPTIRAIVEMLTKRIITSNNTVINKNGNIDDLTETTRLIYQNTLVNMPRSQQRTFQGGVLPKLEEFLNAIRSFQERFKD